MRQHDHSADDVTPAIQVGGRSAHRSRGVERSSCPSNPLAQVRTCLPHEAGHPDICTPFPVL